jgi:hypothetical protein
MEKMLAVRLDSHQRPTIQQRRPVGEATLRAARPYDLSHQQPAMFESDPMESVTFWHSAPSRLRGNALQRMLTAVEKGEQGARRGQGGEGGGEPTGESTGSGKPPGHSGLVGAGNSRVGISGAMRARDVSRLRPEDLAEAEREVRIRHAAPIAAQQNGAPVKPVPHAKPKPGAPVPAPPPKRDPHADGT